MALLEYHWVIKFDQIIQGHSLARSMLSSRGCSHAGNRCSKVDTCSQGANPHRLGLPSWRHCSQGANLHRLGMPSWRHYRQGAEDLVLEPPRRKPLQQRRTSAAKLHHALFLFTDSRCRSFSSIHHRDGVDNQNLDDPSHRSKQPRLTLDKFFINQIQWLVHQGHRRLVLMPA